MPTIPTLTAAIKEYPETRALLRGEAASPDLRFDFAAVEPIHRAFKPMARDQAYDVAEMAIFTYLQAKTYGKPIVLLPVVLAGRLQHGCIVYNRDVHRELTPDGLAGKRVGVRAYSQTTGAWVRHILSDEYGIDLATVRWVTFEGAHLSEYKDPGFVTRAPAGSDLLSTLMAGGVDAAILGNDLPDDPKIAPVIPDAGAAGRAWQARTGLVPINHMLTVTKALAEARPDLVRTVYALFRRSKALAEVPPGAPDMRPIGFDAVGPSLRLVVDLAYKQELIPRPFSLDELFEDALRILGRDE